MNTKNKMESNSMKIKLFFISMILSVSLLACKKDLKNEIATPELGNKENVIDSLEIDINKDGKLDRIIVFEKKALSNRIIAVQLNSQNAYKTINSNDKMIGCSKCGYQAGDPYNDMEAIENGFNLIMEDRIYTFIFKSNETFLQKIDLLKLKQTSEGIEEEHEIYTSKDFGNPNFNTIDDDTFLKFRSDSKKVSLPLKQEDLDKFEWKTDNSLGNYNSKLSLEKYGNINIALAKNDSSDDIFYTLFTIDNKGKTIDSLKVGYTEDGYPENNKKRTNNLFN